MIACNHSRVENKHVLWKLLLVQRSHLDIHWVMMLYKYEVHTQLRDLTRYLSTGMSAVSLGCRTD
jgi:hypothetical protein